MRLSLGKTVVFLSTILSLAFLTGCSLGTAEMEKTDIDVLSEKSSKSWEQAETTPLGKYPELVTYTLGQMKGANNSNLPDGQTYEDNAYTRYLKKTLNIQNKNVFMESEERYDEALNILVKDRNLPDIFLVSDRETLEELVENDLIEDLTEVYKSCASDKIKEMYESYGEELLASGTFDGKLYALPETAIDDGQQLLWLRHDWMEQLGLKEPKTLEEAFSVIRAFQENRMGAEDGEDPVGLVCDPGLVLKQMIKTGETITVEAIALEEKNLRDIRTLEHVFDVQYKKQVLVVRCTDAKHNLIRLLNYLQSQDISFGRVFSELPTLNDVFLEITGKQLRD